MQRFTVQGDVFYVVFELTDIRVSGVVVVKRSKRS